MTTKYDYEEFDGLDLTSDFLNVDLTFFGIHFVGSTMEIDVSRYLDVCHVIEVTDFVPPELEIMRGSFYTPSKKKREDYVVNLYRDGINLLISDWTQEYKPLFEKLMTTEQVGERIKLGQVCFASSADDCDEIDSESIFAALKRKQKYETIVRELYCMFISKICAEVDRITLLAMSRSGYTDEDFSYKQFRAFSEGLLKNGENIRIENLEKYNAYTMLHKINNFLKHNSVDAYKVLKRMYPNNVASIENGTAQFPYENGMFAADWILVKPNYIDDTLKKNADFLR